MFNETYDGMATMEWPPWNGHHGMATMEWPPCPIRKILAGICQLQENKRIGYHKKMNTIYPFAFGLILVGAGIYFYQLGGGMDVMEKSRGTGWHAYQYLIGLLLIFTTGIFLLLQAWMQWKK